MAYYPDLNNLSNTSGIGALLSLPNNSYPAFWGLILFGLWVIISLTLYFVERERKISGNLLSSLSIGAFAVMTLAVVGTLIGFVSLNIMIYILVLGFTIIGIWFFTRS